MLSIQDVGMEILTDKPRKFYVFTGNEYGVKEQYIQHLKEFYGSKIEAPRVMDLLNNFAVKQLIPPAPAVYVVRYDEEFLAKVDEKTASRIAKTNIIGTIICIYEAERSLSKVEKHLADYTVEISKMSAKFVVSNLHSLFPKLPDRLIDLASEIGDNYSQSINICRQMSHADVDSLLSMSDLELKKLFGHQVVATDAEVKKGLAARNFRYLSNVLDSYEGEYDNLLYSMLSALLELEKIMDSKYAQSDLRNYVKFWDKQDIYNMFMHVYDEIKKLRTYATDARSSILYLIGLLQFKPIPNHED